MTRTTIITRTTLRLVRETVVVIETTGEEAPAPAARLHGPGIVRAIRSERPAMRLAGGGR